MIFDQAVVDGDINNVENATTNYVDNAQTPTKAETVDFEEVVDKETGEVEEPQTETKVEEDEF